MSPVSFCFFSKATRNYKNTYVVHLVLLNNAVFAIQLVKAVILKSR